MKEMQKKQSWIHKLLWTLIVSGMFIVFASLGLHIIRRDHNHRDTGLAIETILAPALQSWFQRTGTLPYSGSGWICSQPTKPCLDGKRHTYTSSSGWRHPVWKKLGFVLQKAHNYHYCYRSWGQNKKAKYTLTARADLDCNGKLSLYTIEGKINAKGSLVHSKLRVQDALE